jgi:hypothetical protein
VALHMVTQSVIEMNLGACAGLQDLTPIVLVF